MPSDIDAHFTACLAQVGKLRLFTQLFESELRDEFVFREITLAGWRSCFPLLRLAAEPLHRHVEALEEEPAGSEELKYGDYLSYFHRELNDAEAETANSAEPEAGGAGRNRRPVDRLFAALDHLLDARYALKLWMEALAKDPRTSRDAENADFADPAVALRLSSHWQAVEFELQAFHADSDEANLHVHLIGRKIWLTALAFAVVDPIRFHQDIRPQAIRHLQIAIEMASRAFHRKHLHHKLSLLELLTTRQFHQLSLSPTGFPGLLDDETNGFSSPISISS